MNHEKTFKELLAQYEEQTAELESAFEQLRAMPADLHVELPKDFCSQLDEACAPQATHGTVNLLALRA